MDVATMIAFWIISALASAGGAYGGAYLKKRAEQRAIKKDYEDILDQLRRSVDTTARVERKISHEDWTERELKTLRRAKLELILSGVYEILSLLQREKNSLWYERKAIPDDDPMDKAGMLTSLYFVDIYDLYSTMFERVVECRHLSRATYIKVLEADANGASSLDVIKKDFEEWRVAYRAVLEAKLPFELALRTKMREATEIIEVAAG